MTTMQNPTMNEFTNNGVEITVLCNSCVVTVDPNGNLVPIRNAADLEKLLKEVQDPPIFIYTRFIRGTGNYAEDMLTPTQSVIFDPAGWIQPARYDNPDHRRYMLLDEDDMRWYKENFSGAMVSVDRFSEEESRLAFRNLPESLLEMVG